MSAHPGRDGIRIFLFILIFLSVFIHPLPGFWSLWYFPMLFLVLGGRHPARKQVTPPPRVSQPIRIVNREPECGHTMAEPVMHDDYPRVEQELVAWYCPDCGEQLPVDYKPKPPPQVHDITSELDNGGLPSMTELMEDMNNRLAIAQKMIEQANLSQYPSLPAPQLTQPHGAFPSSPAGSRSVNTPDGRGLVQDPRGRWWVEAGGWWYPVAITAGPDGSYTGNVSVMYHSGGPGGGGAGGSSSIHSITSCLICGGTVGFRPDGSLYAHQPPGGGAWCPGGRYS